MMKLRALVPLTCIGLLAACSSRPVYFGHESSTVGMPGVVNGQKISPNVKLGKPYMVAGKVYVPRYDPTYVEEGMASWYGPGFHGGKTANGETYSKYDYTAAHPTLPMPSIVRVTNLSNGKQVYVRINDRGPYAGGRIIDLSRSAAEQIDLVREGVAKVRVEYMPAESQRFVDLLAMGRDPSSIDIAAEVVGEPGMQVASNVPSDHSRWWEFAPAASAAEASPSAGTVIVTQPGIAPSSSPQSASGPDMQVQDLPPPEQAAAPVVQPEELPPQTPLFPAKQEVMPAGLPEPAPAQVMMSSPAPQVVVVPAAPPATATTVVVNAPTAAIMPAPGYYVQLGSFSVEANALSVQSHFSGTANTVVEPIRAPGGAMLYRVRMGPFESEPQAQEMLDRAHRRGAADAKLIKL